MGKKKNVKYKRKSNNSDINFPNVIPTFKVKVILGFTVLIIIALIARLVYLQFIDASHLQSLATSQQTLSETLLAKRGTIYDATGKNVLAISYDADNIYVVPANVKEENRTIVAKGLSDILGLNYDEVLNKISSDSKRQVSIATTVEQSKVDEIKNWQTSLNQERKANGEKSISTGIVFEDTSSRAYPYGSLASTVIGFVNASNHGSYGIEYSWDSFLSGTSGKSVSLKDNKNSEIANSEQTYIAAENGYDINLTIDVNIQSIVEKYLAEAVSQYKCESGITIAMDPSTGKILAMADYPNYNCNTPDTPNSVLTEHWDSMSSEEKSTAILRMWSPKAITDTYEPGSVFKIITSSIALEENIIEADTPNVFNCTGLYYIDGESKPVKCHKYPDFHGKQSLRNALENSCNPAFMELGLKIGAKTSYKYYEAFGFFGKTGISISGEPRSGLFYDINKINNHELATLSFGQRFNITPIQMITAAAAIANDGVLVQPQIVDKITNTDTGEVTTFSTKEVRQVLSKETADTVASMMESVVTKGTGYKVSRGIPGMEGYSVGGKTGTSEPIIGSDDGYTASFLAISPVENTRIVLLVILHNPGPGINHNGGTIAGPTAGKMLAEILPYMGVEKGNNNKTTNNNMSDEDLY